MKKFLIVIAISLMAAVSLNGKRKKKNLYYEKGYLGNVALGGTVGLDYDFGSRTTLFTSHGYSFGNGAFVGMGTGVIMDFAGQCTIPLFADFKYSFLNKTVSPFIDYKMGISLYDMAYTSLYVSPSVGFDIGRFSLSVGYVFQDCLDTVYSTFTDIPVDKESMDSIKAFKSNWLNFTVAVSF